MLQSVSLTDEQTGRQAAARHDTVRSPQEERLENGAALQLVEAPPGSLRGRVHRQLDGFRDKPIKLSLQRARLLTDSLQQTQDQPVTVRWAKAIANVLNHIDVHIGDDDLIVGRAGPGERYALFYPEVEGRFFANMEWFGPSADDAPLEVSAEDASIVKEELAPYWQHNDYHAAYLDALPEQTKRLVQDGYWLIVPTATARSGLAWCHDYDKVLQRGLRSIKAEAEQQLAELAPEQQDKRAFFDAVVITCEAIVRFAHRHAEQAERLATTAQTEARRDELLSIAETLRWVPENPARSFREAVQSQWLIQVVSRLEQRIGGGVGNGRIDQTLYPYYRRDKDAGLLDDDSALALLESMWLGMARSVEVYAMAGAMIFAGGYSHWEATTIGGQTPDGKDATNELSYLLLRSKREFPLNYPDLAARIHSRTPEPFLFAVCETIKEGTGFPKLLFDEEIIPLLLAKGAEPAEANDYCGAGCTEVKMLNRDALTTGCAWLNIGAVIEMTLNDGRLRNFNNEQLGLSTGDARSFGCFAELWEAFRRQAEHLVEHVFIQQHAGDTLKPRFLASPMSSMLHDLCMRHGSDMHAGPIDEALYLGSLDVLGFGTAVDSLAAIKHLVFDEKKLSMDELLSALESNFKGSEPTRQLCLNAPKYGNSIAAVDSIGFDIEQLFTTLASRQRTAFGGQLDIRYVSVTSHVPLGSVVGATPDGRLAAEPLAEGISPTQGADTRGPSASMASVASTRCGGSKFRAARLLNMKLSPATVAGRSGTRKLMQLIRTACDLKMWHLQLNIINRETLLAAQRDPHKYRNLLVRVAGFSAYFVDLQPKLQEEIIKRTEHSL